MLRNLTHHLNTSMPNPEKCCNFALRGGSDVPLSYFKLAFGRAIGGIQVHRIIIP